jgi:O-antigen/teichoic acid export membrane protein
VLLILAFAYSICHGFWSQAPLLVKQRDRTVTLIGFLTLLTNVLCMIVLAPRYGATGAAVSLLVALSFSKLLVLAAYRRYDLPLGGARYLAAVALTGVWAVLAFSLEGPAALVLMALAFVAGVAYILNYLWKTRVFTRD